MPGSQLSPSGALWLAVTPASHSSPYAYGHRPSVVARYPGRPRLPMAQKPGQKPIVSPRPGSEMLASMWPPLKHILFHDCSMPDR